MCVGSSNLLFGQKISPTSVVECQFGTKSLSSRCALNKRDDFVGLKSDTVNVNSRLAPLRRVFTEICESWFNRLVLKTSDHKRSIRSNRIVSANIYHNQVWRKPSSICWACLMRFYQPTQLYGSLLNVGKEDGLLNR